MKLDQIVLTESLKFNTAPSYTRQDVYKYGKSIMPKGWIVVPLDKTILHGSINFAIKVDHTAPENTAQKQLALEFRDKLQKKFNPKGKRAGCFFDTRRGEYQVHFYNDAFGAKTPDDYQKMFDKEKIFAKLEKAGIGSNPAPLSIKKKTKKNRYGDIVPMIEFTYYLSYLNSTGTMVIKAPNLPALNSPHFEVTFNINDVLNIGTKFGEIDEFGAAFARHLSTYVANLPLE